MAVGFPAKTTYVDGDVFSASDINDTNGTLNLVNPSTTGTVQANPILNSAMQVWQRGTSPTFVVNNSQNYQMDRWIVFSAGSGRTVTRQTTSDTTNLPFIQYCARVQRTSGNTDTSDISPYQPMESINSIPFAGKTVTMSFYARRGANYSATSNNLIVKLATGTGTDENLIFPGYTGFAAPIDSTATLTTTWQRFSYTATLASTITEITPQFIYTPVGTAGADDFFEFTGVQIDVGSFALPFRTYAGTIQGELAACQRYFQIIGGTNVSFPIIQSTNGVATSQDMSHSMPFPVKMRTAPTATKNGTWNVANCSQPTVGFISSDGYAIRTVANAVSNYFLHPDSTDDTITFYAEL
jgi:hypothetical protein